MKHFGRTQRSRLGLAFVCAPLLAVSGCGGSDGDQIGIATGQDPDPVVVDVPIAYIKRPLPVDDDGMVDLGSDARERITFSAGADLFVRDRASPSAEERNVTFEVTEGLGDVRDVDVSFEGDKLVFAMRMPLIDGLDDDEQPTWNIWEYNLEENTLRRLVESDIVAEEGHDIGPAYLPDGRIVFSSTRQRTMKAILLDEGKPQFAALDGDRNEEAFLLHVMSEDGGDIEQISYNQSHDLDATVMTDGSIVFTRWDNVLSTREMNLYRINPDGSNLQLLYGANSHDTGTDGATVQFLQPREMPDGQVLVKLQPFQAPAFGGDLVEIDVANYLENTQPVVSNIGVMSGPAQTRSTLNDVRTDDQLSPGGRYSAAYPLFDGTDRLFVAWSDCRVVIEELIRPCTESNIADPTAVEADPLYGIWIYDRSDDTQLPVVAPEEGVMYSELVAAQPRAFPGVIFPATPALDLDPSAVDENVGIVHIRSVYDIEGVDASPAGIAALADPAQTTAAERPARFVRIVKPVSEVDDDIRDISGTAFGRNRNLGMREIIGYAPVEPDGSVMVKVPANIAFAIEVLDANARLASPRHRNWLQARPGEVLECNGCHEPGTGQSHGRDEAFASINAGSTTPTLPFPNTDPAFFTEFGETMAQVRARISCADDCADLSPSVDVQFADVWTDEAAAGRAADAGFSYAYVDLETPVPTTQACIDDWSGRCRTVINYEEHIHPLWALPRVTLADDDVTVLSDHTCTTCHNIVDAAGMAQVPAGQLDLSDGPSADEPDHFKAYRELYFDDNEQEVVGDAVVDRLIEVGIDPDTMEPIFQTVPVSRSLFGIALASPAFFDRFGPGGSHAGYLSPAELRLLSEWVDIGGQYYNDPFLAPED